MVVSKSKMTHGKDKRNFLVVNAEEFIALITQHIPEKSHQLFRYYGFYSNITYPGSPLEVVVLWINNRWQLKLFMDPNFRLW